MPEALILLLLTLQIAVELALFAGACYFGALAVIAGCLHWCVLFHYQEPFFAIPKGNYVPVKVRVHEWTAERISCKEITLYGTIGFTVFSVSLIAAAWINWWLFLQWSK